jgi:hypothetical protein
MFTITTRGESKGAAGQWIHRKFRPGAEVSYRNVPMTLEFAAIHYRTIRDRILAEDPQIDEKTLPIQLRDSLSCMRS